jgi:hypothetical protein
LLSAALAVSDLLFDVGALGCYIGPRLSEYALTTQDKVDYHTYPSVTTTIKAFIANNFIFYDKQRFPSTSLFRQDYLAETKEPPEWPIDYPFGRE